MSKYYKADDVIRKYAEMIADEAYWELGVGNGEPNEEDFYIARVYYADLPTIDIVICEECRWQDDCSRFVKSMDGLVSTALAWCSDGVRMEE